MAVQQARTAATTHTACQSAVTEAIENLEALTSELRNRGLTAVMPARVKGDRPSLQVSNSASSGVGRMSETITWGDGLFWYSWREPVSGNGDPARTAETIAHVLAVNT
jgi:hypothetical protein